MAHGIRTKKAFTVLFVAFLLVLSGCSANQSATETVEDGSEATSSPDNSEEYEKAMSGKGLTTAFIGEKFYDKKIESEEDAAAAVQSVLERLGGDDTTTLELREIRPTETGTTYYTFCQQAGDVKVHGASVKLVVNKDGEATGLVSAILPNVQIESLESWEVTAEQAQKAVEEACASEGNDSAQVISDATEQTLIALENGSKIRRYAWVVYTNNYLDGADVAYLAHYVSADGEYLYAIPVAEPGNAESLAGDTIAFAFDKYEAATWTGKATKHDGTTIDLELPVLKDPDTGDILLADAERKILCADYADFEYNEKITPRVEGDDGFANNEVLIYDTFIKVWDFFDSIGWHGPDGEGTPTILEMDMVDKNGEVIQNAAYSGKRYGFQMFDFNRIDPDGECYDIIAHEFTHCVTATTMTTNLYFNDTGAINEGMSDIMGNLVEMSVAYDENGAWIIGENGESPLRSMKDPHNFSQPAFVWDVYYGPAAMEATYANDCGGVHTNSSLLNLVSYKLGQAGMSVSDQFYYWMNVALALTPSTDYPQIAELLPWCMEQAGYPEYVDAVKKAVDEGRLTVTEAPATPPEGTGYIKIEMPENTAVAATNMGFSIRRADAEEDATSIIAWVGADTNSVVTVLPANDYTVSVTRYEGDTAVSGFVLTDSGWASTDDGGTARTVTVTAGDTLVLPADGLAA